ncbi:hypothetical protein [Fervidicoccus fontis]|uniref:hypothetical protein n=1 Tax=Fervidicoccus fontis TaxID=683846 RepID=UPI001D134552|nr:hypothetical protein [Fervidicoccus fontis]
MLGGESNGAPSTAGASTGGGHGWLESCLLCGRAAGLPHLLEMRSARTAPSGGSAWKKEMLSSCREEGRCERRRESYFSSLSSALIGKQLSTNLFLL